MRTTNPISQPMIISIVGLLLLLLISSLLGATPATLMPSLALTRTDKDTHATSQQVDAELGRPTTPLEMVLNKDGTLNVNTGVRGSLDPTGWQMTTGSDQRPRFVRAGRGMQQPPRPEAKSNSAHSAQAPLAPGDENWDDRFSLSGVNSIVFAIAISGTNVYVGGPFTYAAGVNANHIARWDSVTNQWYALGSGVGNDVYSRVNAIAISGNDVYVGGIFTTAGGVNANNIARWDASTSQWYPLGSGVGGGSNSYVNVVAIGGNDVYVGGIFTTAGGVNANNIARWDSVTNQWCALGSGTGEVCAIAIIGNNVYVGGTFTTAGGVGANNIARWDASTSQWYPLGSGVDGLGPTVQAIGISGPNVYVGGHIATAGGVSVNHIARWDSVTNQWYPLGSGVDPTHQGGAVNAIAIIGSDVYAGGGFVTAGGVSARCIARWDSASNQWYPLNSDTGNGVDAWVYAIAISGSDVYAGGAFRSSGGLGANYIALWSNVSSQWHPLDNGMSKGLDVDASLSAIAISGSNVYVGGHFSIAGGVNVNNLARWDASTGQWYALGSGVSGGSYPYVYAIAISGSDVYVGGSFTTAGDSRQRPATSANYIARWDSISNQWYPLGSGVSGGSYVQVNAIAVSGSNVYVGGTFTTAGGVSANNIARWDSASNQWYPLGSGVSSPYPYVNAIAVSGSNVYVGGTFTTAGGVSANNIARWDSASNQWYALGSGTGDVCAIAIIGNNVYVGGFFNTAGGTSANNIARWDNVTNQWYPLGVGLSSDCRRSCSPSVQAIAISGSNVYVGGTFMTAGGVSANNIAGWDSVTGQWYPLGSGAGIYQDNHYYQDSVNAIATNGLGVYAGGTFAVAGNKPSYHFGIWHDQWLASHTTWQGRPSQPDSRLQLPITLTLKSGTTEINYPSQSTSTSAYFTTGVGTVPTDTYTWRAKNPKYLANSGTITLTGTPITNLDMGLMRAGDANNDNLITALDFNILKPTYGLGTGDPNYDDRADFNGDHLITIQDFNLLKVNFGQGGAPPIGPGAP